VRHLEAGGEARFVTGNIVRHVVVMAGTGAVGLMAVSPSIARRKVAAADLGWTADMIPFHQPDMAQLRAAAARSQ
jgi:hypothetical protein